MFRRDSVIRPPSQTEVMLGRPGRVEHLVEKAMRKLERDRILAIFGIRKPSEGKVQPGHSKPPRKEDGCYKFTVLGIAKEKCHAKYQF